MVKSDGEKGFSRKSTQVVGNRMKLETSRWVHQTIGVPEMKRTGRFGYSATNFRAISVPAEWGRSISVTNSDIGPQILPVSIACKPVYASRTEYPSDRSTAPMPCKLHRRPE